MRLELTGRHVAMTPVVRRAVERSLARTARMLNDSIVSVQAVITREQSRYHADMTLHARGEHFLHGAATGRDLRAALATAAEKLEHQAQKLKSRWTERKRQTVSATKPGWTARRARGRPILATGAGTPDGGRETGPPRIVRARRRYATKPMSVEEAALEVGAGPGTFIVFRNDTTDTVNVLFRRPDGHLGLIEPEG